MSSETRYPEIDFTPPVAVAREARHGLELRNEHGRGGTTVGIARARELKDRRPVGPSTIKRMHGYFARHEADKHAAHFADDERPTAGYIAWLLWGGDPGRKWADDLVRTMEAADERRGLRKARRRRAH